MSRLQTIAMTVLFLILAPRLAEASLVGIQDAFNFAEDINKFGLQKNNLACMPGKACAAIAAINSFIFLENMYPTIYDNKLTPNRVDDQKTDPTDASNFATNGWTVPDGTKRMGYYPRPDGANEDFIATKMDWFSDFAPRTTFFLTMVTPGIAFLSQEIRANEDVEFFVADQLPNATLFHALTLTGVACNAAGNCTITFLDPDNPTNADSSPRTFSPAVTPNADQGGRLEFNYNGTNVFISAAFAESPIPEPSTFLLLGTAIVGVITARSRLKRSKGSDRD